MTNTLRLLKNGVPEELLSLKSGGADLSDLREQLAHERNARTLTLRRNKRPTIAGFLNQAPKSKFSMNLIDPKNFPFLDLSYAVNQLNTGNQATLSEFLNNITVCASQTPRLVATLSQSREFSEAFINALNAGYSENIIILLIRAMTVLFPISGENKINFVDDGLCMCLFELLSSQSLPLLEASITLVDVISEDSSYARNSILCLGLHSFIIEIAQAEHNEQMTLHALEALNKIFSNKEEIDVATLNSCLKPISDLLSLHSAAAVNAVLMILVAMTNQMSALVFELYDLNLFPPIVEMLKNNALVSAALPLIGNMSICHPTHVSALLNCNLFPLLIELIDTEYTADVFWVLSNLLESVPHLTVCLFNQNFIEKTVDMASRSSYEVKNESTFFLATLIIFTSTDDLVYFLNESVLDLMIETIDACNVKLIVLRCLDSILHLLGALDTKGIDENFWGLLKGSNFRDILQGLSEHDSTLIRVRAECLLNRLEDDSPSILAF